MRKVSRINIGVITQITIIYKEKDTKSKVRISVLLKDFKDRITIDNDFENIISIIDDSLAQTDDRERLYKSTTEGDSNNYYKNLYHTNELSMVSLKKNRMLKII